MATAKKNLAGNLVQGQRGRRRAAADSESGSFLSAQEVARRLDIPLSTFYGWRYKGVGPKGYRLGRNLRFRWEDVQAWLDEHSDDPKNYTPDDLAKGLR